MHNGQYYCSKCAILLLQEGYSVEELCREGTDSSRRNKELEGLANKIQETEGKFKQIMSSMQLDHGYDF